MRRALQRYGGRIVSVSTDCGRHAGRRGWPTATSCAIPARSRCSPSTTSERVLLVRQYRHPVGHSCGSFPPGCATSTASRRTTAQRELLEETGYRASDWHTAGRLLHLARHAAASGSAIFLARGLSEVPAGQRHFAPRHEEAEHAGRVGAARRRAVAGILRRSGSRTTAPPLWWVSWPRTPPAVWTRAFGQALTGDPPRRRTDAPEAA